MKFKEYVLNEGAKGVTKIDKLVEKAKKLVGKDKEKAMSLVYQVLEDSNFHSVNRMFVTAVSKELNDTKSTENQPTWYGAYDTEKEDEKASHFAYQLDWDSRIIEFGNKLLSSVGIKTKLKLGE